MSARLNPLWAPDNSDIPPLGDPQPVERVIRRPGRLAKIGVAAVIGISLVLSVVYVPRLTAPDTAGGWSKSPGGPVIGGDIGTAFDLSVVRDGAIYRAWFSWRPKASIAYVESFDGVDWTEPVIALRPTDSGWEDAVNRPVVIKTDAGFAMWYSGQTNTTTAIGYAVSTDGIHWTRTSNKAVLVADAAWEKNAVMSPHVAWDKSSGRYRMWYSGGDGFEPDAIGYATSSDGIHWAKDTRNPIFTGSGPGNWDGAKVTAADIEPYDGAFVMFYIGFSDKDHAQIGIARSDDGITGWIRSSDNPIIRPGGPLAWDSDAVYKPSVIEENGRWIIWYNGRSGSVEQIGRAVHEGNDLGI